MGRSGVMSLLAAVLRRGEVAGRMRQSGELYVSLAKKRCAKKLEG